MVAARVALGLMLLNRSKFGPMNIQKITDHKALLGDRILLAAILLAAMVCLILGFETLQFGLAAMVAGVLCAMALVSFLLWQGSVIARYPLTFVLVGMVALQLHLAHGLVELHFGVFVILAMLLVYLDWKIILFGAVLFAIHHFLFDRLQAAGFNVYCTGEANFLMVALHASYVIVQSSVEIILAVSLGRASREGAQLENLVNAVGSSEGISLDVAHIEASAPGSMHLKTVLRRMEQAVEIVRSGAEMIDVSCEEIAKGNQDLSVRTEVTASNLRATSSNVSDLSSAVQASAKHAKEAKLLAEGASSVATRSLEVTGRVIETMQAIKDSSHKISDIIGVIDSIAFQTNILALNAAVEAARAGEKGRGFAVVALEVRSLASRSAAAATEIKGLIDVSVERVLAGTTLVEQAGKTMSEVVGSITGVAKIITDISDASTQQADSAVQVNAAVGQMDEATQQNAALVEEMAVAASSLRSQANDLVQAVSTFRVGAGTEIFE